MLSDVLTAWIGPGGSGVTSSFCSYWFTPSSMMRIRSSEEPVSVLFVVPPEVLPLFPELPLLPVVAPPDDDWEVPKIFKLYILEVASVLEYLSSEIDYILVD